MSCQVEKKSGKDDYIEDHRKATNSFKISTTDNGLYKTGDVLTFTLSFPSDVIVTGSPRLRLGIDTTNPLSDPYADYVSGNGTKTLTFKYTVLASDNDSTGIEFMSIDLNGGTLEFYLKEVLTNCSTVIKPVRYSKIIIDNTAPTVLSITNSHTAGIYYWNDVLSFAVKFNETIFITGTPTLPLTFNTGGTQQAQYVSGSGTDTLIFKYTIANTIHDVNGIDYDADTLILGGGSIKDRNGNDAVMTLPPLITSTALLQIDGRLPKIEEIILPPNKTYQVAEYLDFTVLFDRPVDLIGTPHLLLTVGSTNLQAEYLDGTGTNGLTFRYTPLPGHVDLNGITLDNAIQLPDFPTSDIRSATGNVSMNLIPANNNLKSPITTGLIVNAVQPAIERISRGTDTTMRISDGLRDNVWRIGQALHLVAEFNTVINVNIDSGSPTLHFSIGGVPKVATYLTGGAGASSMTFVYIVLEGDQSTADTINISNIQLNNAVVTDSAGTIPDYTIPNTTINQTTIDGIRPTITSFLPPANGFYSDEHTTAASRYLQMTATFNEPVNLSNAQIGIDIVVGMITRQATLYSGNNTLSPIFRYNIANGDNDSDGVSIQSPLNTGAFLVRDLAGNEMQTKTIPVAATPSVIVDTTHPTVAVSSQPTSRVHLRNETLTLELTFNEQVTINASASFPRIPINNLSPATRYFTPDFTGVVSGTVFSFSYDITAGDLATTPISLGAIGHGGGSYIRDRATNDLAATTPSPGITNAIRVDAVEVRVNSSSASASAYYRLNDILDITLTFSEAVFLTGTPLITASVSGVDYDFSCNSGSGTITIICSHTITNQTLRLSGLGSVGAINLNGGSIRDNNNIDATLTFTSLNLSGLKIVPDKFLSWSQGTVTDVISNTALLFNGSFTLDGSNFLSATHSAKSLVAKIQFDSASGSILNGVNYTTGTSIILTSASIQSVRVNGTLITEGAIDDFDLGVTTGVPMTLEIDFIATAPTNLFDTNFIGQITSILLLNSTLSASERSVVVPLLN